MGGVFGLEGVDAPATLSACPFGVAVLDAEFRAGGEQVGHQRIRHAGPPVDSGIRWLMRHAVTLAQKRRF